MALIDCPECSKEVSESAASCPHCGHPIGKVQPQYKGPPVDCRHCGGALKKKKEAKSEAAGCLISIIGLALTYFIIGIPILIAGIYLMFKSERFWQCRKCDAKFPRQIHWYEFG